jgi:hypothetical protein
MKSKYINFGETVDGYDIPVLNEREARAGAGILLIPAISSFFISYLSHDFTFTKIFVTVFMVDFFIRIFINPKYAPSLILGRIFVHNQTPEYVGASQKRFAWYIGLVLSVVMFFIIVVFEFMTPLKIIICLFCVGLLFSESAFGICLGCIIYHKTQKNSLKYCPGNVCEVQEKSPIQEVSKVQLSVLVLFFLSLFVYSSIMIDKEASASKSEMKCQSGKCGSSM